MGNSLRDQLLKTGLVDEKKLKQTKADLHQKIKQQPKGKGKVEVDEAQLRAQKAAAEKVERDRQLDRTRQDAVERKAMAAQINEIIAAHRLPQSEDDTPYYFTLDNKIKRVMVSTAVRAQIGDGRCAVVKVAGAYAVVPAEAAEKIRQRDPSRVVVSLDATQKAAPSSGEDPYKDFPIPDDLMW